MADEHGGRLTLPWSNSAQRILRREPACGPVDWRDVLRARLFVCASLFAVWTVSIEAAASSHTASMPTPSAPIPLRWSSLAPLPRKYAPPSITAALSSAR